MANYNVDIAVAVTNSQAIARLSKDVNSANSGINKLIDSTRQFQKIFNDAFSKNSGKFFLEQKRKELTASKAITGELQQQLRLAVKLGQAFDRLRVKEVGTGLRALERAQSAQKLLTGGFVGQKALPASTSGKSIALQREQDQAIAAETKLRKEILEATARQLRSDEAIAVAKLKLEQAANLGASEATRIGQPRKGNVQPFLERPRTTSSVFQQKLQVEVDRQIRETGKLSNEIVETVSKYNQLQTSTDKLIKTQGRLSTEVVKPKPQTKAGGGTGGGNRGLSNLALGVGFPLLFGGGAGSVAGGALGSVGGMGGQVLGSAIGGIIDQAVASVARLGQAFTKTGLDSDALAKAIGDLSGSTKRLIEETKEVSGSQAAAEAAAKLMAVAIGDDAVTALTELGNASNELGSAVAVLGTEFQALAAQIIGPVVSALAEAMSRTNKINAADRITAEGGEGAARLRAAAKRGAETSVDPIQGAIDARLAEAAKIVAEERAKARQEITDANIENSKTLEILEAEGQILDINKNLLDDKTLELTKSNVKLKYAAKLEEEGLTELQKKVLEQEKLNELKGIDNKATQQQQAADREASRKDEAAARKAAREQKARDRKAKQLQQSIFNEDLKQLQIYSQIKQFNQSELEAIRTQKEELSLVQGMKRAQIEIEVEDLALRKEKLETLKLEGGLQIARLDRAEEELVLAKQMAELSAGAGFDVSAPFERNMKFMGGKSVLDTGPASFEEGIDLAPLIEYEVQLDRILEKYPMIGEAATAAAGLVTFGVQEMIDGTKSAEQVFADFLNSIADMLLKTAQQMIAQYIAIAIAKMFAGMGSGMGFSDFSGSMSGGNPFTPGGKMDFLLPPGRANGGSVSGGRPYTVGERGPELFVPGASGTIIPNHAMGGVNVDTINITVENTGEQLNPAAQKQLAGQVQGIVLSTLANERRSGGML